MKKNATRLAFAGLLAVVLTVSLATLAVAGPIFHCPDVWAPVLCENGKVYSNSCYASLAGQKNCVPADVVIE